MRALPPRSVAARSTQFAFVVFAAIGLLLSLVFAMALPAPLSRVGLILVAGLAVWAVALFALRLRVSTYRFGSWFTAMAFSLALACLPFLFNALYWVSVSATSTALLVLAHVVAWGVGYLCGHARLDHSTRAEEFDRFIRPGWDAYVLSGAPPTWAACSRSFQPAGLEKLFRLGVWILTGICLVFAVLGAGGATAALALIGVFDVPVPGRHVGMASLAIPSLLGLGYLSASVFTAARHWRRATKDLGKEVWPTGDLP